MSEEYGAANGFIRTTTPPDKSRRGSSPKKARYTGASIASLRANIASGKLEDRVRKYNAEYDRLTSLAMTIDEGRAAVEAGEMDYAEVAKSIKAYNEQARRLAEIGVQVLVLNQDIQKITFAKEQQAKAIRVPGFLIGPLRLLSAAGREKARLEKEARMEKEQAIYDSIVKTAEDAIGQVKDSQIDEAKFDSLAEPVLAETIASKLVEEPSADLPEEKTAEKTPEEIEAEEVARKAAEEAKKKAEAEAAEAVAKRNQAINDGLNNAYKKRPDPKKKREDEATARKVAESGDSLAILANLSSLFHVAMVKSGDKSVEMLEVFAEGKRNVITPSQFGMMCGIDDKTETMNTYRHMIAVTKLASLWEANAVYEIQENETVKRVEAFSEENKVLFNFMADAIRNGMTAEEIKAQAESELSAAEVEVLGRVLSNYEVLKAGITSLDVLVVGPQRENSKGTDGEEVDSEVARKVAVVDDTIARLAVDTKYGSKRGKEDVPPVEEQEEEKSTGEDVPHVEEEKVTPTDSEPVVAASEGGYVSQIGILVNEIADLTANRNRLSGLLGAEAQAQLDALNAAISNKLAQINALALGGIVSLGKDGDKKSEGRKAENVEVPIEDEVEHVEETSPIVLEDKASIEMSIEEKAEIDARVVNGAHVKVDAIIENFVPGKKYVLETRVKGKKATLVVEDDEEVLEATAGEAEVAKGEEQNGGEETERREEPVVAEPVAHEEKSNLVVEETPVDEQYVYGDSRYDYDRGIMSDKDKAEAIAWWSKMAPILNDPRQQALSEMKVAEAEREIAAAAADRAIKKERWEENRQRRIEDGWLPLDEEVRAQRIEEQERLAEQIARSKLKKCKYFEGLDDVDATIDGIIAESDGLNNAQDVVRMISEKAPQAYADMEERYREEKLSKLSSAAEEVSHRAK